MPYYVRSTATTFFITLKKEAAISKKYIHPEAFELVRRELFKEVTLRFIDSLKRLAKLQKTNTSKENELKQLKEELATSFVACLMYLSQHEFRKIKEKCTQSAL
ncbi:hypothetical protein OS493_004650 [Desmophyllum pertusum]|uniref:Uncharacterized protein n=1 Tax=Desmophyllum pertusum TaxID=174260 RepID=A0A9W9ZJE4_9CNID|nr:hypothetical protein OS493_004650 [Desmophyllum pertusum]